MIVLLNKDFLLDTSKLLYADFKYDLENHLAFYLVF